MVQWVDCVISCNSQANEQYRTVICCHDNYKLMAFGDCSVYAHTQHYHTSLHDVFTSIYYSTNLTVTPIVRVCNCSMFCCTLLYVHSSIAIILIGKRELVALLNLSSWCLVMVRRLFLAVPGGCLQFVIVVFPDHTHLLFLMLIEGLHVTLNTENILAMFEFI